MKWVSNQPGSGILQHPESQDFFKNPVSACLNTSNSGKGASFIYKEANARYRPIAFSVRGRGLQSAVAEAEARILEAVDFPSGYRHCLRDSATTGPGGSRQYDYRTFCHTPGLAGFVSTGLYQE